MKSQGSAPELERRKTVAERFDYNYSDREIDEIMGRAVNLGKQVDDVHVVFNNNRADYAPKAAERLRKKLGQSSGAKGTPKQVDLL